MSEKQESYTLRQRLVIMLTIIAMLGLGLVWWFLTYKVGNTSLASQASTVEMPSPTPVVAPNILQLREGIKFLTTGELLVRDSYSCNTTSDIRMPVRCIGYILENPKDGMRRRYEVPSGHYGGNPELLAQVLNWNIARGDLVRFKEISAGDDSCTVDLACVELLYLNGSTTMH
jgi:hypothetical protein